MIGKVLTLPFWTVSRIIGLVFGSLKLVVAFILGIFKFVFSHLSGTIFGALAGLLLGRKHVGIKWFTHKKRKHA